MKHFTLSFVFGAAWTALIAAESNLTPIIPATPPPSQNAPSTIPTLLLKATIEPLNSTELKVSFTNTYPQSIAILSWNNHLSDQNSGHGSFRVTQSSPNGTVKELGRGFGMGQYLFNGQADPSHFVNLMANETHTDVVDMSRLFAVPQDGDYNVTLSLESRAMLQVNGTNFADKLQTVNDSVHKLPKITVSSDTISMHLQASAPMKMLKRFNGASLCKASPANAKVADLARSNAHSLATFALNAKNADLYAEYLNDTSQYGRINDTFKAIYNYGSNGPQGGYHGISEYCDSNGLDTDCNSARGIIAFNTKTGASTSNIVFCKPWFGLSASIKCGFPSYNDQDASDQGGTLLHELTHSPQLVGYDDIKDGNACYNWTCITGAASGTNGEPRPWLLANAYEFYAYGARVLDSTSQCSVDPAFVTNSGFGAIPERDVSIVHP